LFIFIEIVDGFTQGTYSYKVNQHFMDRKLNTAGFRFSCYSGEYNSSITTHLKWKWYAKKAQMI
jgi:hypothetical protein